jgi:hypothetical protein
LIVLFPTRYVEKRAVAASFAVSLAAAIRIFPRRRLLAPASLSLLGSLSPPMAAADAPCLGQKAPIWRVKLAFAASVA